MTGPWVLIGVSVLALTVATMLVYALVTRYGRVLLRLDELERRLAEVVERVRADASARHALAPDERGDRTPLPGELPLIASHILRNGLEPGTPAPEIDLVDVHDRPISLSRYRSRPVVLVFSDLACGPCDVVIPELARLDRERDARDAHDARELAFLLVGRGDREANRRKAEAHGVRFPVVVQRHWEISKMYGIFATPVAFLIGADGLIKREVARGVDQILALTREALMEVQSRSRDAHY
jgi:peroxiredoxin